VNIEEKVYELLAAALPAYGSPPSALVTAAKIKPPGDWQSLAVPYVVHFPVAPEPIETHQGQITFKSWRYQVSVFATTYKEARAIIDAARVTLTASSDPKFFWVGQTVLPYEHDVKIAHIAIEFDVWEAL
jgi:hypothetical protein